jgi:hypothetical protein
MENLLRMVAIGNNKKKMEIKDYPCYLIYEDGRVWSKNRQKYF